ncbi:hypothetical protein ACBJ59_10855 [Nonomuraea sp. MTCD27]|uniref:hypothetical protein n=1 Tax=Nonomuraea sp. MTCD27 TaxID=1676747 RepID=UPI0035C06C4A
MTLPAPCRLADALEALASWSAHPPCPSLHPQPHLTGYLHQVAEHVRATVADGDPRLAALEGVTDPDGYPWLNLEPESGELQLFTQAAAEAWPPDHAITALCEMARREAWEVCGVEGMRSGLYEPGTRDHECTPESAS